ncbi:MAG TPA: type I secretion system permease/ATPase, partial [Dongiaceae bacterium]|nr:type I secretion system permease/ATPase [Dongiaceae bacterium]
MGIGSAHTLTEVRRALTGPLLCVGLFSFCGNLLLLVLPLYTMQLFDRVIVSSSYDTLTYLTLAAVCALVVLAAFDFLRTQILVVLGSWIEARLAPNAFLGVIKVALRDGSYQTEALRDLASLRLFMTGGA